VSFWRAHRPNLNFRVDVPEDSFGEFLDGTVYRIVQESLSNAVRHGNPGTIEIFIAVETGQAIRIRVVDDGGGLRANGRPHGLGIVGMQERVASLGGMLEVKNRPDGRGVIVAARIPLHASERAERAVKTPQEIVLQ
jgi:two-component system sensor histidine kinase UhpB